MWAWNFGVYPAVLWFGGLLWGSICMVALNFGANYGTLRLYDLLKRDWLAIELAKQLRESEGGGRAVRLASWALKKGDPAALIVFSLLFDPFVTTAYLRHGANRYDGLSRRDWAIFLVSFAISTAYWIAVIYGGLAAVQTLL